MPLVKVEVERAKPGPERIETSTGSFQRVPAGTPLSCRATAIVPDTRRGREGLDVRATVQGWPVAYTVTLAVREANKVAGR